MVILYKTNNFYNELTYDNAHCLMNVGKYLENFFQ